MIRRPPRSTLSSSSAASDVYKRQVSTQSTGANADKHADAVDTDGRLRSKLRFSSRNSCPRHLGWATSECAAVASLDGSVCPLWSIVRGNTPKKSSPCRTLTSRRRRRCEHDTRMLVCVA
eukprot:TRINITY_DN6887_c0_g1_i6.p1 TRINITY_DN6887_c0_g1~~TRINITY_DN6887_c0_g1_i6.p1  ORF type:complete len:120 (+),score=8.23 TRINITY_DN6887_c0_g1_i6:83-442(+)